MNKNRNENRNARRLSGIEAFLIDLDGVLYMGTEPVPGVKECLDLIEDRGYGYRFVSNSTRRCRNSVAKRLQVLGYDVPPEYIFTRPWPRWIE